MHEVVADLCSYTECRTDHAEISDTVDDTTAYMDVT